MSQQGSGENEILSATPFSGKASTRVECWDLGPYLMLK